MIHSTSVVENVESGSKDNTHVLHRLLELLLAHGFHGRTTQGQPVGVAHVPTQAPT